MKDGLIEHTLLKYAISTKAIIERSMDGRTITFRELERIKKESFMDPI
jgi:hypothetical protein